MSLIWVRFAVVPLVNGWRLHDIQLSLNGLKFLVANQWRMMAVHYFDDDSLGFFDAVIGIDGDDTIHQRIAQQTAECAFGNRVIILIGYAVFTGKFSSAWLTRTG